jgi:hypothetical protein
MKKILCLVAIIACAACSSTPKQETTVSSDVPNAPAADAKADAAQAKADAKTAAKDAAKGGTSEFGAINGTEKSSVTCTNKSDSRKITVMNVTEGGCGVVYNKAGADKTVAMAKSGDYCDNVANKIKTNLEGAGFDCGGGTAAPADKAAPAQGTSSDTAPQGK